MRKYFLSSLLLTGVIVVSCKPDKWEGYIYPNRNNLFEHIFIGEFETFDECRDEALARLEEVNALDSGDYECGKNCRSRPGSTLRICEETMD